MIRNSKLYLLWVNKFTSIIIIFKCLHKFFILANQFFLHYPIDLVALFLLDLLHLLIYEHIRFPADHLWILINHLNLLLIKSAQVDNLTIINSREAPLFLFLVTHFKYYC